MNIFTKLLQKYDNIPKQIHSLAIENKPFTIKHQNIIDLLSETFDNHFQVETILQANNKTYTYIFRYNGKLYQETIRSSI